MKKCYTTIETIIELLPVQSLANLCGIHRSYCYKLLKTHTRLEIFNKYCEIMR